MKRLIIVIVGALIVGFFLGKFIIDQYESSDKVTPTFNVDKGQKVYFLQYGVYSNQDSMESNTINLSKYIYTLKDNLYYVFIGITKNDENVQKLKGYFKDLGYSTYVKEFNIKDETFLNELSNYDLVLKETSDSKAIETLCSQILEKYERIDNL